MDTVCVEQLLGERAAGLPTGVRQGTMAGEGSACAGGGLGQAGHLNYGHARTGIHDPTLLPIASTIPRTARRHLPRKPRPKPPLPLTNLHPLMLHSRVGEIVG